MPGEFNYRTTTGQTIYAILWNGSGQFWNTTTPGLETYNSSNWASYAVNIPELSGSGIYQGNAPSLPADVYQAQLFQQVGGSPATTDAPVTGIGQLIWNGTGEITVANVQINLTTGAGTVLVNQDSGGVGNLRYANPLGVGIEGADVLAFVSTDYAAGNLTVRGKTTTDSNGNWVAAMELFHGITYTFLFQKPGQFGPDLKQYSVP